MGKQLPIEIFMPPNVLRAKAGGRSRNSELAAVMRAEAAVDALKLEYTSSLAASIARLEDCRNQFSTLPDQVARAQLLHVAATLRDEATSLDFASITRLSASLINLLESSAAIGPSLELIDAHVGSIHAAFENKPGTAIEDLEARVAETADKTSW